VLLLQVVDKVKEEGPKKSKYFLPSWNFMYAWMHFMYAWMHYMNAGFFACLQTSLLACRHLTRLACSAG
jgi:hypothetical protein